MCLGQRDTGTRGTDGSQTHRWREQDSNPRSLSEGEFWKGPGEGMRPEVRFAADSSLEGDGFELPVPREKKSKNLGIPLEFN